MQARFYFPPGVFSHFRHKTLRVGEHVRVLEGQPCKLMSERQRMAGYVLVEIVLVNNLNTTHLTVPVWSSLTCWIVPYNSDPRKELRCCSGVSQANTNHRRVKDTDSNDEMAVEIVRRWRRDVSLVKMIDCFQ